MEWHNTDCKRLDIVDFGNGRSCLACGSIEPESTEPRSILPPIRQHSEIRILRLQHGIFDDPIVCEVCTKDLALHPEYEAVSYTWADESGDAKRSRTIHIGDKPYQVTVNCENALRRLRRHFSFRKLWIDAICVDQDNLDERAHQVQLMPRIYSGAKAVQIYVGELTLQSQVFLQGLLSHTDSYEFHQSTFEFVSRRYFSRAWILQEVTLARQATVICGSISIPWSLVKSGKIANLVQSGLYSVSARQSIPPCFAFDHSLYSTPGQELKLLDFAARNCVATDPRDKIFSLLGMIPGGRLGTIEADYSLGVSQLYAKTAHYLASQHGWMSVLCRAGVENAFLPEIPSWAPDWTRPLRKDPATLKGLPMQRFENGEWDETSNTLTLKFLRLPAWRKQEREAVLLIHEARLVVGPRNIVFPFDASSWTWGMSTQLAHDFHDACYNNAAGEDLTPLISDVDGDYDELPGITVHCAKLRCRQAGTDTYTLEASNCSDAAMHWSYMPARIAVQVFTMTITEMHCYQILGLFTDAPIGQSVPSVEYVNDTMVDLLHRIQGLRHQEPTDAELEDLWMNQYRAGNLVRIEALQRSSVRLQMSESEPNPSGDGPNSVHHPEFVRINDGLWRLLVRNYVLQETTIKLV
ncbi:HET-domain-containing protein [Apiospora phragmitis]|uniref:HET-domain-containing protein n=1 Tax=Apiospora phragmitis TaxID=2905665 RepID=A0ABR1T2W9_9PEZI